VSRRGSDVGGNLGSGANFWRRIGAPLRWLLAATDHPATLRRVGTGALVAALLVSFLPGLVPWGLVGWLEPLASVGVVVLLGVVVAALGAALLRNTDTVERGDTVRLPDYDDRTTTETTTVGAAVDDPLATLTEAPESTSGADRNLAAGTIHDELFSLAVETLAAAEGCDSGAAAQRVTNGDWTDDPRAAAFLGDESVPRVPVRLRIVDWVRGEPVARRVEATVDAIARHAETDPDVTASLGTQADDSEERDEALERLDEVLEDPSARAPAADGGERP